MKELFPRKEMGEPQKRITSPSFFTGNEVVDVFLPIMGADCFTIYAYFKRIEFTNPKLTHTIRAIHEATGLGESTVSRSLEILEHLGLMKLTRFRGSKASQCQIPDPREVAFGKGARYDRETVSYSLPPDIAHQLKAEVTALRERQQGKSSPKALPGAPNPCGHLPFRVSQRNAGVSPEKRQRPTRETQTGSHLIREERRIEEIPSPTPSQSGEAQNAESSPEKGKDFSDKDEPEPPLKWATAVFTGVMNDFGDHLLETSRPPAPHLANGAEDWSSFGFGSLAVAAAEWRGEALALTLSVGDPEVAKRGLYKYRKKWEASVRAWYECEVSIELVQAQR